jgi:Ran GTPase-activating protein (RanGAP) involved in mRNA processing and transport
MGLMTARSITNLSLSNNGIGDEGGIYLGQALLLNETLHTLDLSCCRLGPGAALVMSQGVRRNATLRRLICDSNPLGEPGGRHLLASLKFNHHLELLSLRGIQFRDTADSKVRTQTRIGSRLNGLA